MCLFLLTIASVGGIFLFVMLKSRQEQMVMNKRKVIFLNFIKFLSFFNEIEQVFIKV